MANMPEWMIEDTAERIARLGTEGAVDLVTHIDKRFPNLVDDLGQAINILQMERQFKDEQD